MVSEKKIEEYREQIREARGVAARNWYGGVNEANQRVRKALPHLRKHAAAVAAAQSKTSRRYGYQNADVQKAKLRFEELADWCSWILIQVERECKPGCYEAALAHAGSMAKEIIKLVARVTGKKTPPSAATAIPDVPQQDAEVSEVDSEDSVQAADGLEDDEPAPDHVGHPPVSAEPVVVTAPVLADVDADSDAARHEPADGPISLRSRATARLEARGADVSEDALIVEMTDLAEQELGDDPPALDTPIVMTSRIRAALLAAVDLGLTEDLEINRVVAHALAEYLEPTRAVTVKVEGDPTLEAAVVWNAAGAESQPDSQEPELWQPPEDVPHAGDRGTMREERVAVPPANHGGLDSQQRVIGSVAVLPEAEAHADRPVVERQIPITSRIRAALVTVNALGLTDEQEVNRVVAMALAGLLETSTKPDRSFYAEPSARLEPGEIS
jgi:hypothetical protein